MQGSDYFWPWFFHDSQHDTHLQLDVRFCYRASEQTEVGQNRFTEVCHKASRMHIFLEKRRRKVNYDLNQKTAMLCTSTSATCSWKTGKKNSEWKTYTKTLTIKHIINKNRIKWQRKMLFCEMLHIQVKIFFSLIWIKDWHLILWTIHSGMQAFVRMWQKYNSWILLEKYSNIIADRCCGFTHRKEW